MKDIPLTDREQSLLDAIQLVCKVEERIWVGRGIIAFAMNKKRLDSTDGALLEGLEARGFIKSRRIDTPQGVGYLLQYSIVDGE